MEKTLNKSIFCGDEKRPGMRWKSLPNGPQEHTCSWEALGGGVLTEPSSPCPTNAAAVLKTWHGSPCHLGTRSSISKPPEKAAARVKCRQPGGHTRTWGRGGA